MVAYPQEPAAGGRRGWRSLGGTLNGSGTGPGMYYRAPVGDTPMPGSVGYLAERTSAPIDLNEYAVFLGVKAIQAEFRALGLLGANGRQLVVDGLFGTQTAAAAQTFQATNSLPSQGLVGQKTAKKLFWPLVVTAAESAPGADAGIVRTIMLGTVQAESSWDPGAVGSDPDDLGLAQINGPNHPDVSVVDRFNPRKALPYMAKLVAANLRAFNDSPSDAVAAYNLGPGGARSWIAAGRPEVYKGRNVGEYIDKILSVKP